MTSIDEKSEDLDWQHFFQEYQLFTKKRDAQKARGINDYSLLASVLDVNDEVRLHSRFLYSLLNPCGNHYQGSLFLELFLKAVGLEDNWLDYDNVTVAKEKSNIDIHITDGQRHIIIENKLDASDQKKQVQHYIEHVKQSYNINCTDILFIYLSKDREEPSSYGLGECKLSHCKKFIIMPDEGSVAYNNAHYKNHVINWLKMAKKQAVNLTNLYNALDEYEKVVLKAVGLYESNVMNIKDFLISGSQLSPDKKLKIISSIEHQLDDVYGYVLDKAMTTGIEDFMSGYPVEKINDLQFTKLKGHLFIDGEGKGVFEKYKCNKCRKAKDIQKGSFWRITSGEYKDKLMLTLWMATEWLHVGVIPISKDPDELFSFSDDINFLCSIFKKVLIDDKKLEKRDKAKPMPALISWGDQLEKELGQMYDFDESRQGKIFSAIFERLGIAKNIALST